ncbi:dolichol-phosphate mannosyltransferase subunit 3-like [Planococcus citri]|uniref:dolichol-phosphate mannosyltransferase subunit 3-like n=1 Tax=Planococcus citri TaxID=170843 RepID=UPI0031F72DA8
MTKLIDWMAAVCAFLSIWLALLYHFIELEIINEYRGLISLLPVFTVFIFGLYSAGTVLWRVYNFNDCNQDALDLQMEIKEARKDLIAKGFVFQ